MHFPTDDHFSLTLAKLPVSPHVLFEVIGLCNEAETITADIIPIIRKDAVLASRVIDLTGFHQGFSVSEIMSTDPGMLPDFIPAIRSIASTAAIQQFFQPLDADYVRLWSQLWMNSLTCANLCQNLANQVGMINPDQAFMAGLLHQLGRFVYFAYNPDDYTILLNGVSDNASLLAREASRYGSSSAELGANIITRWKHADFLADAVRYQCTPVELLHDATHLVRLLNLTSRLCDRMFPGADTKSELNDPFFGLGPQILEKQLAEATASAIAEARDIGMQVEESSLAPEATLDNEQIRLSLGQIVRDSALQESIEHRFRVTHDTSGVRQGIQDNLRILLGVTSAVLFLPDFENNILKASNEDQDRLPGLQELSVSLKANRSLIAEAALKKRNYLSTHQDRFTQLPIIDLQIRNQLGCEVLLYLPLVHQRRLYGVLAASCSSSQAETFHTDGDMIELFTRVTARTLASLTLSEITHRAQLEQQELEAKTRVRKIIHEVNNPLTVINNYLEILGPELKKSSANKKSLDTMQSEVDRVAEILQRFRQESNSVQNDQSMVNINELIQKTIEFFEPTFYKRNRIKSVLRLDPSDPTINTDSIKLKQVLTNILKNATEALTDKGEITIKTRGVVFVNSRQYVEITVSDNGDGLPQSIIQNLYTPVESTKGADHSGLGLTIVYKLVSELRGIIHYASGESGGAEFTILLPGT
jgi:signal transduction histidine kinase